jgi:5-methyltetrahydrofolate--homocysteine methyltransferase
MSRFLDALRSGRVLLMDGAMGTELRLAGLGDREPGEAWNLTHPERVAAVHRSYAAAGATVHLTNTFQAYPDRFQGMNRPDLPRMFRTCRAGVMLASETTGAEGFVLADLGPPPGPLAREFAVLGGVTLAVHFTQPVDGVLLETCSTPRARFAVVRALRVCGGAPVLLSLTYRHDDEGQPVTVSGHPPAWFARRAARWGLAALGVNCGREITVADCAAVVRQYRDHTDLPLFARPNAGTPNRVGDGWVYPHGPEEMAGQLPELLEAGVSMVGGCCGTTPEHIAAFRRVVDGWNARRPTTNV